MAKIDVMKEKIGYLKVVFSISIAINISLIAWLFQHSSNISNLKIILSSIVAVMLTIAIIIINRVILNKIDKLEDL